MQYLYTDLAYSLLEQNINRVMFSEGRLQQKRPRKKSVGLITKLPETSSVARFMEEMSYVLLSTFFLRPLIFTLVAASISHFLTRRYKISMFFFQRN